MRQFEPYDVVRVTAGLVEFGVPEGSRAVVLEVHEDPYLAYEIEVVDHRGQTIFTGAVDPAQIEEDRIGGADASGGGADSRPN